ncbi:MAG: phosphatase PAP2 family protein [Desulfobacteraceae bacterium]|nr:MAG: phosphatase PAP2 family protein [Desulfobacteraceae bacterium]
MEYFIKLDRQLLKWAYQRRFEDSAYVKTLIFMGDGPFWMITLFISALAGQLLSNSSLIQLSIILMLGLALGNFVFTPLKGYVKRLRPYADRELHKNLNILIKNRDPGHGSKELESFPSGHVLWTTICVSLICFQYGLIAVILLGWMIPTMIFLRPYLGVHYPSDALAGLAIGITLAAITMLISPMVLNFLDRLKDFNGYIYGYWVFITIFLIVGFKSWLKRV